MQKADMESVTGDEQRPRLYCSCNLLKKKRRERTERVRGKKTQLHILQPRTADTLYAARVFSVHEAIARYYYFPQGIETHTYRAG